MPKHKPPPLDLSNQVDQSPTIRSSTSQQKMYFNWEDWLPYLQDVEGSEAQKRELILMLRSIIIGFVDMGWEVGAKVDNSKQNVDLCAVLEAAVLQSETDKHKEEV